MSEPSFTEELRREAGGLWDEIIGHRFTDELAAGTIDADVLKRYLIQDHRFLDAFVVLLASAVASARTLADRIPGCQFLALITGRENTYFERSFEALGVSAAEREATPDLPVTIKFNSLMRNAAASGVLAEQLAVLVVAEWSYQCWGERVLPVTAASAPFTCREWVDLHSGPGFGSVVAYLRGLLDREATSLSPEQAAAVRARFMAAVRLEKQFFDAAYDGAEA